ncbi:porin [Rhodobacteraceae bacterium XHP0102]|nr:porin [Rhodobacteraceae bacterium XHP0102]
MFLDKCFFATTALVASAAMAQADITLSGTAEMGIVGGEQYGLSSSGNVVIPGNDDFRFHQGYTMNFGMTSTTDSGLEFGANFRLDMDGSTEENQGVSQDAGTVFISGAFGKLTMGDTDGAADWALSEMALAGGSINDAETGHAGYTGNNLFDGGNDDQVLRYEYSMGDVAFAISHEQAANGQSTHLDDNNGIGVKYTVPMAGGSLALGAGYATGTMYWDEGGTDTVLASAYTDSRTTSGTAPDTWATGDAFGVSAVYTASNGFIIGANYSQTDLDDLYEDGASTASAGESAEITTMGLGAAYTTGAWTFAANYGTRELQVTGAPTGDAEGYALIVNYDLGGGAVVQFGYADSETEAPWSDTKVDYDSMSLGIAMSF